MSCRPMSLEELVNHFVAAKRSLNTQTVLWGANDQVNQARLLLEEASVLTARVESVGNTIEYHVESLKAIRHGMRCIEDIVQSNFQVCFYQNSQTEHRN